MPAVAVLKVHKAAYGARVLLNGVLLGEHMPSFTPGYFDARPALRGNGAENELVVRVGASPRGAAADGVVGLRRREEPLHPGTLRFGGADPVRHAEHCPRAGCARDCRPDHPGAGGGAQCRAEDQRALRFKVREARSGKIVGEGSSEPITLDSSAEQTVEVRLPIRHCRLWSPEDPFLYELETSTGADTLRTRFGMREFRLDHDTGRAMLNGRPYYLRGSNVTLYRFFEDPQCADRPWREEWVRRLHRTFKGMHWNALRYCIGFPPECWYRIADEEGILIQDEFPIWRGSAAGWPAELTAQRLSQEYTEWMQERWNHPCVVIWDAQNETRTTVTGKALQARAGPGPVEPPLGQRLRPAAGAR